MKKLLPILLFLIFNGCKTEKNNVESEKWLSKTIVTFGDSITWYDGKKFNESHAESSNVVKGYQYYLRRELGCYVDNQGVSGYDMTQIYQVIKNYDDFDEVDAILITSGANDHRKAVPVGDTESIAAKFDTTTFTGSLQASIEFILTNNPSIRIYLMTPIIGYYNESGTSDVPGPYKGERILSEDYVAAIKKVGNIYNIPVCDVYHTTGINKLTRTTLIGDKVDVPYYLHPTQEGYQRIANVLIPFLKNF
ncbi:SGNH/GDSL hydrolase family protein [Olivibacter sp. 47]|uniref:SGNH/GDSL hydrolase family protein n=1 Tax=Olivibacter sp. 47 TaxID=3056486 RepID=UPI0025A4AB34|nr:SGNH/GDSL hydrolase family protein [Olivibacter sp. 47]MDM8174803.1 SGNH/GDSL hydrolase family protein [Olivibacter sp. 47]